MLCAFPITLSPPGTQVPCGQCMPCRVRRQKAWAGRILLELGLHQVTSWVTLTYNDDSIPSYVGSDGTLCTTLYPEHLRLLFKRLRKRQPFRYFACGEYGKKENSFRPHYHALLFGVDPGFLAHKDFLEGLWGKGFVTVDDANQDAKYRASYVAHYTVKKLNASAIDLLDGQHPEFARMSMRPGIGCPAVTKMASAMNRRGVVQWIAETGDVPAFFRIDGRLYPLDTTVRTKLREALGVPAKAADRLRKPEADYDLTLEQRQAWHDKMHARLPSHGSL